MIYINIIIIIIILYLYIRSFRNTDSIPSDIDRKKHKLYFLYPMAAFLLTRTGIEKILHNRADISRKIRAIYITDYHEFQTKLYWYQKISLFLFIIFSFSCISMIISLQAVMIKSNTFEASLVRPNEGEGDSNITLQFRMENENDMEEVYEDEITIQNKERLYTDKEWSEVLDKAIPFLEQEMLGENVTAGYIDKNLNLINNIPSTGITVEWIPSDYRLITGSGKLINENMTDGKTDTIITAILKYEDKRVEHTIPLTIWPVKIDSKTMLYKELQDTLDIREKDTALAKEWELPRRVGNYLLTWQIPERNSAITVLLLGVFGSVLLWAFMDKSLDDKMKLRKNQMLLDYPEIINKFNLLVNAGMTIRQSWIKICEDYRQKSVLGSRQTRYAYEEMLLTLHELKLGVAEANAYEQFGTRIGLMPFMKFSSMLVQNLKKGNKNIIELLKQEAKEAFLERKETTKRLGEEASTKLLGPMMIMLLIVLSIILMPAFISLRM